MNSTQPGNAGRILIVDDEKDITNLFADLMRDMGYEVRAADDGEVALQIIGSYRPDIVVSDIHMPRIDGDEFYRRVVNMIPSYASKFIFITGSEIDTALGVFLADTKCAVFFKPFDILELSSVIKSKIEGEREGQGSGS